MTSQPERYTSVAIALHWIIALAVFIQISLGWWMQSVPKSPPGVRAYWYNVHKSIGLTIALLVLLRLAWRLTHRPPPLPARMPRWERFAAKVSHIGLYACLLIMPTAGYLGSNFTIYPIKYFGYKLPHWGWDAPALKDLCSDVHYYTAITFMTLIVIHVAAALKHLIVDRDGVFQRMWPWSRSSVTVSSPMSAAPR